MPSPEIFSTIWKAKDNRNCIRHLVYMFSTIFNLGYIFEGILQIILIFTSLLKLDKYPWHKNRQFKSNTITGWASELQSMDWFKSRAFKRRRKSLRWQRKHESSRISNVLGKLKNTYFSSIFTGKLKYLSTWHLAERIPYIILFTSKYYKTFTNSFVIAFI